MLVYRAEGLRLSPARAKSVIAAMDIYDRGGEADLGTAPCIVRAVFYARVPSSACLLIGYSATSRQPADREGQPWSTIPAFTGRGPNTSCISRTDGTVHLKFKGTACTRPVGDSNQSQGTGDVQNTARQITEAPTDAAERLDSAKRSRTTVARRRRHLRRNVTHLLDPAFAFMSVKLGPRCTRAGPDLLNTLIDGNLATSTQPETNIGQLPQ